MTGNDSEGKRRVNRALISSIGLLVVLAIVVTLARPSIPGEALPTATTTIAPSVSASPMATPHPTAIPTATLTSIPVPQTRLEFLPDPYQGPLPEGAKAVLGIGTIPEWEVSPNRAYLVVVTGTNLVTVYAIATWETIWFDTIYPTNAYKSYYQKPRWSPDSSKVSIHTATDVFVWDAKTGRKLYTVDLFDFYPQPSPYLEHEWGSAEWSPDGKYLALGSGEIFLINGDTGHVDRRMSIPGYEATDLVWSADGTKLGARVGEGFSRRAVVWNLATAEVIQAINEQWPEAWSSDLKVVVTRTNSGYSPSDYVVWNVDSGRMIATSDSEPAISPDGTKVAINDGEVTHILDTRTGVTLQTLERDSRAQEFLSWSPNSTMLVTASVDTGKVWDIKTGQVLFLLPDLAPDAADPSPYPWARLRWSPDSTQLITGSSADLGITVWDVETGEATRVLLGDSFVQFSPGTPFFFPDSNTLLLLDAADALTLLNSETGEVLHQIVGTWGSEIAWSEDSSKVALITGRNSAFIWDVATGTFLEELSSSDLTGFMRDDEKLADNTSPDGSRTETTKILESGMAVTLQNPATNQVIRQIPFPGLFCEGYCLQLRWSPDSRWLAIGADYTLYIHRADTGARVSIKSVPETFESFAFSPDGKLIAAIVGGAVIVWQVP